MRSAIEVFETLADTDNVTYTLCDELCIGRTNAAWEQFARTNGGERILARSQSKLLEVVPESLQRFFIEGFARASETGERWEHDYECSSPDMFRTFRMLAYPCDDGFVVTHAPLVAHAHDREPHEPDVAYVVRGVVGMCSHCRRVRHVGARERWDWVPSYVTAMPPNVSHGLCLPCYRYYYE